MTDYIEQAAKIIEEVAQAIAGRQGTAWESRLPSVREEYRKDARAAITAYEKAKGGERSGEAPEPNPFLQIPAEGWKP